MATPDQRQGWDAVSAGWQKWWSTFERGAQKLSDRMVELAGIGPGSRILDVATGIGEPAVTAARRAGSAGRVVAIDLAPAMLAIARQRAQAAGLANIEFLEMDAEAPALPPSSFDAVLCRWALMFFGDLRSSLARLRALLKPGGRIVAAVWGDAARVPLISIRSRVVQEMLQEAPAPGAPGAFTLSDSKQLVTTLEAAGFAAVEHEIVSVVFDFASPEVYTRFQQDVSGPRMTSLLAQPAERQAEVWRAVTEAARQYAGPDGALHLANEVVCVVGK
jgi:SAM-dependent methyltransferase